MASIIQIDNKWLNQVKKVLVFPKVDELYLSDDQIKEFCIFPAMTDYFRKFPKEFKQSMGINGEIQIDFPDEATFGVLDARVVDLGLYGGTGTSFWDLVLYQQISSTVFKNSVGAYGATGYNPNGLMQQRDMARFNMKSYQNMYTTIKYNIDQANRKLVAYTSLSGKLDITWAKYSNDFEEVMYEHKNEVVWLSQAYLLEHLSDTAGILSDQALDMTINVDALKTRASELKEKVKLIWDEYVDIICLHNI